MLFSREKIGPRSQDRNSRQYDKWADNKRSPVPFQLGLLGLVDSFAEPTRIGSGRVGSLNKETRDRLRSSRDHKSTA